MVPASHPSFTQSNPMAKKPKKQKFSRHEFLVRGAAAGSRRALEALISKYLPALKALARLHAPACPDEAVSLVLFLIVTRIKSFRCAHLAAAVPVFAAWFRTITKRASWAATRRLRRGGQQFGDDRSEEQVEDTRSPDLSEAYEKARWTAFQAMSLSARLGWISREVRLPAAELGRRLGVLTRGANYHVQIGSLIMRSTLEVA